MTAEGLKSLPQTRRQHLWQPEMKRTGHQSWSIRGVGQVVAQLSLHEILHPLRRRGLPTLSLFPAITFQALLQIEHAQGIVAFHILGSYLHHHTTVRPFGSPIARAHAVDHDLPWSGGSRDDKTTRTHAERVNPSPVDLGSEAVFGRRQVFSPTLPVVVLYLVDEVRRMFQPHPNGQTFGLNLNLRRMQVSVDVACRVPGGEDNRSAEGLGLSVGHTFGLDAHHLVGLHQQSGHAGLEMHLAPTSKDGVAHVFDDPWQFVGADMRMCVGEDVGRGPMLAEHVEDFLHVAPFFRACVEFSIREGTCPTLPKTVVALRVDLLVACDGSQVALALMHIFSPLHHNGAQS